MLPALPLPRLTTHMVQSLPNPLDHVPQLPPARRRNNVHGERGALVPIRDKGRRLRLPENTRRQKQQKAAAIIEALEGRAERQWTQEYLLQGLEPPAN